MFKYIPRDITPIIKEIKIDGIAGNTSDEGGKVCIITKDFKTSSDEGFEFTANQLIAMTIGTQGTNNVNQLLVLIKKDDKAYIYTDYHFNITIRSKREINGGMVVFESDIADIESVSFDAGEYVFDFEKGDKVFWLFREKWKFGLYYNTTKESTKEEIYKEMGTCYKLLKYFDLYTFLEENNNFNLLVDDGWFPFIDLIGKQYKELLGYYTEKEKFEFKLNKIIEYYDNGKISQLTEKWWNNKIFKEKESLIKAGINSYFEHTKDGYINCIKNLATELEGIIRISYNETEKKSPNTKDIKGYVINSCKTKFSSVHTLSFPELFHIYLNEVLFKGFDVAKSDIPGSRHAFAHGVAKEEQYTKPKALQIILSLDQIYYYL